MVAAKGEVLRLLVMANVLLFNMIISCTSGYETYLVGDDYGWRSCCTDYSVWAAKYQFYVGDVIVFEFSKSSMSNVAEVNEKGYHECLTQFSGTVYTTPPVNITLNSTGYKYFISAGPYCTKQSLAINVAAAENSPPDGGDNEWGKSPPSPTPTDRTSDQTPDGGDNEWDKSPPPPSPTPIDGTSNQTQSTKDGSDTISDDTRNKIIGGVLGPVLAAIVGALITGYCRYRTKKKLEKQQQQYSTKPGDQVPPKPAAGDQQAPVFVSAPITMPTSSDV